MANLYTSALLVYAGGDPIEDSPLEFAHDGPKVTVEHYTALDVLIGEITPDQLLIENYNGINTRLRVYPAAGQVAVGEKIKIIVDDA